MKLFTIPNFFTLGNLLCGCLAIVFAFDGNLVWSAYLVGVACVFDFLDGFLARLLKVESAIGKQLDSLADMVTFGVVPGVVMFKLMIVSVACHSLDVNKDLIAHANQFGSLWVNANKNSVFSYWEILPYTAFLIPLFSALRLAKFNVDTRQSDSFIGVPTPANAILICSLPLILRFSNMWTNDWPADIGGRPSESYMSDAFNTFMQEPKLYSLNSFSFCESFILNPWVLIGISIVMSVLLIAEIPLFALKFKNFGWKGNEIRYIFLSLAAAMILVFHFVGIPLVIMLYILLSVGKNVVKKSD